MCEYKRSSRGSGCLSEHNVTAAEQWLKSVNYAAWHGAKPVPDFSSFQYANHALNCVLFLCFTSSLCFQSNKNAFVHIYICVKTFLFYFFFASTILLLNNSSPNACKHKKMNSSNSNEKQILVISGLVSVALCGGGPT